MQLRTELLAGQGFALGFLETKPPREAALDDFYDACACAWSANRILGREARVFPAEPDLDAEGLEVAIRAMKAAPERCCYFFRQIPENRLCAELGVPHHWWSKQPWPVIDKRKSVRHRDSPQ
jgi:Protein of unknown function (DUF429)